MNLIDLIKQRIEELEEKLKQFPGIKSVEKAIQHNKDFLATLLERK